jgi:hypothetical protein
MLQRQPLKISWRAKASAVAGEHYLAWPSSVAGWLAYRLSWLAGLWRGCGCVQ